MGGVLLDAEGRFRFVIRKRVDSVHRQAVQYQYLASPEGGRFWSRQGDAFVADAVSIPRSLCSTH